MFQVELRDDKMKELAIFIEKDLGLEAIYARADTEEMIGLFTTKELISPTIEFALSSISKKYSEDNFEVQLMKMNYDGSRFTECYLNHIDEVKDLIIMFREMVRREEEFKQKINELITK